jgi:hypothetical protein
MERQRRTTFVPDTVKAEIKDSEVFMVFAAYNKPRRNDYSTLVPQIVVS